MAGELGLGFARPNEAMNPVGPALSERERPSLGHVRALDGLGGVAVLLVLLFHLNVFGFGSGYLGVDVFFVLSGFLITSLLLAEAHRTGRIAVVTFWARRVRRLMPALVILLFVVAMVTARTATFSQRASMRGDLLSTTTYMANWHFITASGYFRNTGTTSPLQHTWSLAIEEQFYLVWPLLLALLIPIVRRPRLTAGTVAAIGVVLSGVVLALLWSGEGVDRAYMGTDARIFEPLVGALGAVLVAGPRAAERIERFGTPLVTIGSLGLIAGLSVIRAESPVYFLGGGVVISIFTVMLIAPLWVGKGGALGRVFAWRPLAWLGVVSYGVYLWHWPLLTWLGFGEARGADAVLRGSLAVVLTVGVAALSYYAIERPIRIGRRSPRRTLISRRWEPIVVLAAVPLVMLAVASTSISATVVPPPSPGVPVILLTGDSVVLRLETALERAVPRGWRIVSAARGACAVTGEQPSRDSGVPVQERKKCPEAPGFQDALIRQMHPDIVVWWDRWSLSSYVTADGKTVVSGSARFWRLRRAALELAVQRLTKHGAIVVFVATEPPGKGMLSRCGSHCDAWIRFQIDHYQDITSRWNQTMLDYAEQHPDRAAFVSITDMVCRVDKSLCNDLIDGVPARPDGTHYEGAGQKRAAATLLDLLTPILARTNHHHFDGAQPTRLAGRGVE
jgi:peptidoglycan/LPS O-acetylase OafA/YrhL